MATSLTRRTTIGVALNFVTRFLRTGVAGITTLVLAWFLSPEDFALIAMIAVFVALASVIVEAGLRQTLIRMEEVDSTALNTAFVTNASLAVATYGLLFLAAPWIAAFYEQPSLIALIRVVGIAIFFNAVNVVPQVILARRLDFLLELKTLIPASLIAAVIAVVLAIAGAGVWAIIAQMVVLPAVQCIILFLRRVYRPSATFSVSSLREMLGFAGFLLADQFIGTPFRYVYVIVIAKVFAAPIAGLYFFADRLREQLINQLVVTVQTVSYPALSRLQGDPSRLKGAYRRVLITTTFLVFPVLVFIAAVAEAVFALALPPRWMPAADYLSLMCLATVLYPLHAINLNILRVTGRSDLVFFIGLVKRLMTASILVLTFEYGVIAILLGEIVSSIVSYLPNSFYSRRLIDYPAREQARDCLPALLLALVMGVAIYVPMSNSELPMLLELAVAAAVAPVFYLAGAYVLRLDGLAEARGMMTSLMGQRGEDSATK